MLYFPYLGFSPVEFQIPATMIAYLAYILKPIPVKDYDGDSGSVLGQPVKKYRAYTKRPERSSPYRRLNWYNAEGDKWHSNGYNSEY